MSKTDLTSTEKIEKVIYVIRGEKVMLDRSGRSLWSIHGCAKSGSTAQFRAFS
jgi:hypothetical protein